MLPDRRPGDGPGAATPLAPCICGAGGPWTPLYAVAGHAYVRCGRCGSARLDPLPAADPVELFDDAYFTGGAHGGYADYDADGVVHLRNARRRLRRVERLLPPASGTRPRLLDVGCASGHVLAIGADLGWDVAGVDVSAWARERAAGNGFTVRERLSEGLALGRPDVVTLFQVLEHLAAPDRAIHEIAAATGPGAVLAIETWDLGSMVARAFGQRWQQANPPSVVHLFTRTGLRRLLDREGFDVVRISVTPKLVGLGMAAGIAAHRWGVAGARLRRAVEALHLQGRALPYPLPDLITVTARRR